MTEPNPFHEPDRFYKSDDVDMGRVRAAMHDAERLGAELTASIRAKYGLDQPVDVPTPHREAPVPTQPAAGRPAGTCWVPTCPRTDVHAYIGGRACPDHTPARIAGHPEPPTPDPRLTAAGFATRDDYVGLIPRDRYGRAKSDPLGRIIKSGPKEGFIPRYRCPSCTGRRAKGHKGEHT